MSVILILLLFFFCLQQQEKIKRDNDLRKAREEDEKRERERERERIERDERDRMERERREIEEKERYMNEQARREAEERRNREERDRIKRESLERERLEKERREREERERKQKREQEERDRRERERLEQERRAAEERRKFEEDAQFQAERKKKDEILQKLREIDEGVGKKKDEGFGKKKEKSPERDPFFVTQNNKEDSQDSMASSKKSYTFTKPVQNLHQGKPSHKESNFTVGPGPKRRNNRDVDDLETGGYNPTFGSKRGGGQGTSTKTFSLFDDEPDTKTSQAKPDKKSKLMEDLFGSQSKDGPKHNDMFESSKPAQKKSNPGRSSGFPWDDDTFGNKNQSSFKANRENSATLFGGGSALITDDELTRSQAKSNAMLPRRPKQTTTTFSSRPTVNAIDHFDDEIEEVIL